MHSFCKYKIVNKWIHIEISIMRRVHCKGEPPNMTCVLCDAL